MEKINFGEQPTDVKVLELVAQHWHVRNINISHNEDVHESRVWSITIWCNDGHAMTTQYGHDLLSAIGRLKTFCDTNPERLGPFGVNCPGSGRLP